MEDLQNKDKSIIVIWNVILTTFGMDYFQIVDFWDADNYAFGFKRGKKLVYISTWDFKDYKGDGIKCYSEFELIDEKSFETKETIKQMNGILLENLLDEIRNLMNK